MQQVFSKRYEVIRPLKKGGMGELYLARQKDLDRRVVLKVLAGDFAGDPTAADRFKLEMQVMSRLEHPNIVRLYDYGRTPDGKLFIVMEYVDGRNLDDEVQGRGPIGPERTARVGTQIARALTASHAEGIVHRDLKPENIMIRELYGEADHVTVLDFGVAKYSASRQQQGLTQKGMVVGTPAYVSPEQAMGRDVDPRSDIYSLGGVMFYALVGREPFESENVMGMLYHHVNTPAPVPAELAPGSCPTWLSDLVVRMLSKEPSDRPATAKEVAELLAARGGGANGELSRDGATHAFEPGPVAASPGERVLGGAGSGGSAYDIDMDLPARGRPAPRPRPLPSTTTGPIGSYGRPTAVPSRSGAARSGGARTWLLIAVLAALAAGGYFLWRAQSGGASAVRPDISGYEVERFEERCAAGNTAACLDAAKMYRTGDGAPESEARADELYRQVVADFRTRCDGGGGYFCYSLSQMYDMGEFVERDSHEALRLRRKACDLGYEGACP